MHSIDPLHLLALMVCAFFTGLVGNLAGIVLTSLFTRRQKGDAQGWTLAGQMASVVTMIPVKIGIAVVVAIIGAVMCGTAALAVPYVLGTTAAIGFLFTTALAGILSRG